MSAFAQKPDEPLHRSEMTRSATKRHQAGRPKSDWLALFVTKRQRDLLRSGRHRAQREPGQHEFHQREHRITRIIRHQRP